jgi:CHAD domain-containing protein
VRAELLPPEGMTLEAAAAAIAGALTVRERVARERERRYYDTFDGLVRASGHTVVHEDGELALAARNGGAAGSTVSLRRPSGPLLASQLPGGPLREALAAVIEVRALLPVARVHSRERAIDVLDDERKTVVRMTLSAPAVTTPDGALVVLRPRLVLTPLRGYDDELERARTCLIEQLHFVAPDASLEDDAIRAAGGVPGGAPSAVDVALSPEQPTGAAVAAVLTRLLEIIRANFDGTVSDIDSEFLHDLRVAVRRSRAVLRELDDAFPADARAHFQAELRWLQLVTGPTRDLDVQVLGFEEYRALVPAFAADLEPVLDILSQRRRRAFLAMRRELSSQRTGSLLDGWAELLLRLPGLGADQAPAALEPIHGTAGARIRKVCRRMVRMGEAIGPDSPPEALHELRKQGKELRYLLELFGAPLFPAEVVKPLIKRLKTLQDVLGRHQDRAVQIDFLRGLSNEVATRSVGPDALLALGALVQSLLEDERAAREQFAERFAGFATSEQRRLVKETFR